MEDVILYIDHAQIMYRSWQHRSCCQKDFGSSADFSLSQTTLQTAVILIFQKVYFHLEAQENICYNCLILDLRI